MIKKLSLWWQFITLMKLQFFNEKIITLINVLQFNENWAFWWTPITLMKNRQFDENPSLWWKFINLRRKIPYCEESCLTFIVLMKKSSFWWKKLLLRWSSWLRWNSWWKYITMLKIYQFGKNSCLYLKVFQYVENS